MSQFTRFLKKNKAVKENTLFAATDSLTDENGKPLQWEIKPLTTKENEEIRESCTITVPDESKPGAYKEKLDFNKYKVKVLCASVVEPCLNADELLQSYGVYDPEDLLLEMIDNPGEFNKFSEFVFNFNGFGNQKVKVEEVKN